MKKNLRRKIFSAKRIIVCVCSIIVLNNVSYCQQKATIICGSLINQDSIRIKIYEPVSGYYNFAFYESDSFKSWSLNESNSSFHFKRILAIPVTIEFYITSLDNLFLTRSIITIFPGDSVHLIIDTNQEGLNVIKYSGSNAVGHFEYNKLDFNPIEKYRSALNILNDLSSNRSSVNKILDDSIGILLVPFKKFATAKLISKDYYDFISVQLKQLLYNFFIDRLLINYKENKVLSWQEKKNIVATCYKILPVSNSYVKYSFNSYFYLANYHKFLALEKYNFESVSPLYRKDTFQINSKLYRIGFDCSIFQYFADSTAKRDLWALYMLGLSNTLPVGSLDSNMTIFKELYPNSKWNEIFATQNNRRKKKYASHKIHFGRTSQIFRLYI